MNTNTEVNSGFNALQGVYGGIAMVVLQSFCPLILEHCNNNIIPVYGWEMNMAAAFVVGFTMNVSSQFGVFSNLYDGWLAFLAGGAIGFFGGLTLVGYLQYGHQGASSAIIVILLVFFALANIVSADANSTSTWNFANTLLAFGVVSSVVLGGTICFVICIPALVGMIVLYINEG